MLFFFFKQKTAYEMRISDWSSDVCSSDLIQDLSPAEADARLREGTLTIVDVRPPQERELAAIALPYAVLDAGGLESLLAQPRDLPLGFLCHHGGRSAQAGIGRAHV